MCQWEHVVAHTRKHKCAKEYCTHISRTAWSAVPEKSPFASLKRWILFKPRPFFFFLFFTQQLIFCIIINYWFILSEMWMWILSVAWDIIVGWKIQTPEENIAISTPCWKGTRHPRATQHTMLPLVCSPPVSLSPWPLDWGYLHSLGNHCKLAKWLFCHWAWLA